ncbi:hypothetical protein MASR1M66_01600 [Aminivibrio sp.]
MEGCSSPVPLLAAVQEVPGGGGMADGFASTDVAEYLVLRGTFREAHGRR